MADNTDNIEAVKSRATELQQENELLLVQLHHAQDELERNYSRDQKADKKQSDRSRPSDANAQSWIADELPDMYAENRRLRALVDVQRKIHELESNRALNVRLGNILIEGVDSPGSLLTVPGKLVKIWRQASRQTPPAALGGKDFNKTIAAYQSGGFDAVEKSMERLSVSSAIQANAYTALARNLAKSDRANAAEAARRAYNLDPKAFRLKWLAFRLHEAGDVIEAEAMLDVLPAETQFSESEARQARQLRAEAKGGRQSEAKQNTSFAERRAVAEMRVSRLEQERDQQSKLAAEHARQIEVLSQAKAKLEQDKSALSTERDRIEKQLCEMNAESMRKEGEEQLLLTNLHQVQEELEQLFGERESLQLANARLEREIQTQTTAQAAQSRDVEELVREIGSLRQDEAQRQAEKVALLAERDRIEKRLRETEIASSQKSDENRLLLADLHQVHEVVKQLLGERERQQLANAQLEREIQTLANAQAAQSRDAEDRIREIETLEQTIACLENDKQALAVKHETQSLIAERYGRELETLKHEKALLEQGKLALSAKYEMETRIAEERNRELDALRQTKSQLEQEKQSLAVKHEVQSSIAAERVKELEALKQAKAILEREKQALTKVLEAQTTVAEERGRQLEVLTQTNDKLEQEKRALADGRDAQTRIAQERAREVETLKQATLKLEQEKQTLAEGRDAQTHVAQECARELETLKQAALKLEQEKQALSEGRDAQTRVAQERARELETFKQAALKLEQEKQTLTEGRDEQTRVAQERARELETLKQAALKLEQEKAVLVKQKQAPLGIGSGNRGDADIDDLIGDLELFFNGKAIIYVDVGAYVGDVFMKIKSSIKNFSIHEAHLYEPNPASYEQLMMKIAGLEKPIVHTYNVAVGESSDVHRFIPAKSMTKALPSNLSAENVPADAFAVNSVSLDRQTSIFTDGKINLLKIDVEGRELDVLSSARELLTRQSVDILYIEVGFNRTGNQQTYFAEVDQFLQGFGYRVIRVYEQKEEWMNGSPLLRRANIAYMSENFANAHPLKLMRELRDLKSRVKELASGPLKSKT
jgi:FkbM family methyltransferase